MRDYERETTRVREVWRWNGGWKVVGRVWKDRVECLQSQCARAFQAFHAGIVVRTANFKFPKVMSCRITILLAGGNVFIPFKTHHCIVKHRGNNFSSHNSVK